MSIRINLLAEAKIAEEARRRDPVKRTIYIGALLVVFALVWSSSLQLEVMISRNDLTRVQADISTRTNDYQAVLNAQDKVASINKKIQALQRLTDARFLQGNCLNALQQATMSDVQLLRIHVIQTYASLPGPASKTADGREVAGHPASVCQKIVLSLDAKDFSPNPGDAVDKFKDTISSQAYFRTMLNPTNGVKLISLSAPQTGVDGRPNVLFNLECYYSDKIQ